MAAHASKLCGTTALLVLSVLVLLGCLHDLCFYAVISTDARPECHCDSVGVWTLQVALALWKNAILGARYKL